LWTRDARRLVRSLHVRRLRNNEVQFQTAGRPRYGKLTARVASFDDARPSMSSLRLTARTLAEAKLRARERVSRNAQRLRGSVMGVGHKAGRDHWS